MSRNASMKLTDIHVGKRHRVQGGDVTSLAESIIAVGLLHPIVVDGNGRLIAGERRLAAARLLGWREIPARVVETLSDAVKALRAERDENTQRKAFLPSELVSVARALEPLERAEAKARQLSGLKRGADAARSGKLPERQKGDRRDKLASVVGVSGRTLEKAKAVVEAAERDPTRYRELIVQMDRTGKVNGAFAVLQRLEHQATVEKSKLAPLPKLIQMRHCSMQTLLNDLRNVDAIITDPCYGRDSLPLYCDLARLAAKALRPHGVLAVMCGQSYLPEILAAMTKHIAYRWTLAYLTPVRAQRMWARKIYTRWKPVLVFGTIPRGWARDVVESEDSERKLHKWEQSADGMFALIKALTEPGWLVCDPFLGSGTAAVACKALGRRFIGCDTDPKAVRLARWRLASANKSVSEAPLQK